jgi:hypothetical protein
MIPSKWLFRFAFNNGSRTGNNLSVRELFAIIIKYPKIGILLHGNYAIHLVEQDHQNRGGFIGHPFACRRRVILPHGKGVGGWV